MIQLYFVQFKYPGESQWFTVEGTDGYLWKGGRYRAIDLITEMNNTADGRRFRLKPVTTVRKGGL